MSKGKKRTPKSKGIKSKRAKRGSAIKGVDRRKIDTINKKLSEFYNIFGEYSPQYQELKTIVLTQLQIYNPQSPAFDDYFSSRSPMRLSTDTRFIGLLIGDKLNELYGYFKGKTPLKEARKIEGYEKLRTKKQLEQKKSQIKYDTTISGLNRIRNYELKELISYLPQFYTALDEMDAISQEKFRKDFREFGLIKRKEEKDKKESEAQKLMDSIYKYFDAKEAEGSLIKKARSLQSHHEQLITHQKAKFRFVEDVENEDDENNEMNWSNINLKK